MENKTILSLEINGNKFSAELDKDAKLDELIESFAGLCICGTFMPKNIYSIMKEVSESMLETSWPDEY